MIKHIKILCLLICITLPLMFFGVYQYLLYNHSASRGNFFFDNTRNNVHVNEILLEFPNHKTITFVQKENFWHVKEVDDYYASFSKIINLMKLLNNTVVYRVDTASLEQIDKYMESAISIKTIDNEGHIVDHALIAPKLEKNQFHYAQLNNLNYLYQLIGSFELSDHLSDWLQMPLLKINYQQIKYFNAKFTSAFRSFLGAELLSEDTQRPIPQIQALMNNFWYLTAEDVRHAVHFNSKDYSLVNSFEITLFNGIIYKLSLFYGQNEYWLSINLSKDLSLSPAALIFINENKMLYDGWFFKLNQDIGSVIASFNL